MFDRTRSTNATDANNDVTAPVTKSVALTRNDPGISNSGSVMLGGVTVALDTDIGQQFIIDCARNIEGQIPDREIKNKYELSDRDWERLAENVPLLQAVQVERKRRILSGEAAKEAAQHYFAKAPIVLNGIMADGQVSPRHRIEAARELRQAATTGAEISAEPKEKVIIHIDFGADCKIVREITLPAPLPTDDGEVP